MFKGVNHSRLQGVHSVLDFRTRSGLMGIIVDLTRMASLFVTPSNRRDLWTAHDQLPRIISRFAWRRSKVI